MLFRLVCGPELEEIWTYANAYVPDVSRESVNHWFVQQTTTKASTTNIDEALTVLRTLRLVSGQDTLSAAPLCEPFRLGVLRKMRDFELGRDTGEHVLDSWYMRLLEMLFIAPDITYLGDLHRQANRLNPPMPINDEKLNAWRRVLEWLGVGRRVGNGFLVLYSQELLVSLLDTWDQHEGPLADFLQHVDRFLPCVATHTDLPQAFLLPLTWLDKKDRLKLTYRQDAPYKAFGGSLRFNWISAKG